jgi:hypothetical protein
MTSWGRVRCLEGAAFFGFFLSVRLYWYRPKNFYRPFVAVQKNTLQYGHISLP